MRNGGTTRQDFIEAIGAVANSASAVSHAKFFQAFPCGYGEGDKFWGVKVPDQRKVAKDYYRKLELCDYDILLDDPVHEVRLTTLMAMVYLFEKTKDADTRKQLFLIYTSHTDHVNNWDLVDSSAAQIVGGWLWDKPRDLLDEFALSGHLWKQRIAMIATHYFIKRKCFEPTLHIAELLLNHKHDLIHKAVGWMLREVGNLDYSVEYDFLLRHYREMPRTMLRYAIEKFEESTRQDFLKGRL